MMRLIFAGSLSREGRSPACVGVSLLAIRARYKSIASKLAPKVNVSFVGWASAHHLDDALDWLRRAVALSMLKCCLARRVWRYE